MFESLFKRPATIERYRSSPLAELRLNYLVHCTERGAKPITLRRIACAQLAAVRHLELAEKSVITMAEVHRAAEQWIRQRAGRRNGNAARAHRRFVGNVTGWLRFARLLEVPRAASHPHSAHVADFEGYMREQRGWSEATVRGFRGRVDEFLRRFADEGGELSAATVTDIDRALARKGAADGCSRVTIRSHADALRAFFRHAEQRGWCRPGLAEAIKTPPVYKYAGLPVGPSPQEFRRLLATTNGNSHASLRDRAVLLLLALCGLRAGEARGLRLDDIDWAAETIRVRRPKTGRTDTFPLAGSLGLALFRYVREARPCSGHREVFLSLKAPVGPLGPAALSDMVRTRMRRAGVDCPGRAAHALRHFFAQRLLEEGFSMSEIGACLGHQSLHSTALYAKVDLDGLRQVADFDLDGLL